MIDIFSYPLIYLILFLVLGLCAGFFAGTLGVGGGIIIVPALYWIFSLLQKSPAEALHQAIGSSLCIMIITALSASSLHIIKKRVAWRPVLWTSVGTLFGAFWGPYTSSSLPTMRLKTLLGLFEILMGIFLIFKNKLFLFNLFNAKKKPLTPLWFIVPGILIAYFSTLLGIGGGMFYVPLFLFGGYTIHQSVAASTLSIFPLAIIGTLIYWFLGTAGATEYHAINLQAFILVSIGSLIGSPMGAHFCYRIPQTTLRYLFAFVLIVVGILFFI